MSVPGVPALKVVQAGVGEQVHIGGFGAAFKLYSRDTGGVVSIVEHQFSVGMITAPHMHSREDEYSIVLEGQRRAPPPGDQGRVAARARTIATSSPCAALRGSLKASMEFASVRRLRRVSSRRRWRRVSFAWEEVQRKKRR
jgi:hypothetical protein